MFTILKCLTITIISYITSISVNPELPNIKPIKEQPESSAFLEICIDKNLPITYGIVNDK